MTSVAKKLPLAGRIYVYVTVLAGCAVIVDSAARLLQRPPQSDWLLLAGLTLLTGSFTIKVPSINARISVSETFVLAAVMSFGPAAATVIVALDTLVFAIWLRGRSRSIVRTLFNMSAGAAAIWAAAHLFEMLIPASALNTRQLEYLLFPALMLALSYFLINSFLIAGALGFERQVSPLQIWGQNFPWLSLNYLGGASVALLIVNSTRRVDFAALSVIIPLLVITYLTFRTAWGRLEDANVHVAQLNELYLSTIETLAMAVDAKDQITHGHIRRVQVYAVELAKRLGINDPQQLKAVEAAALLHDMGKLAIPEHILNKPGKLTATEFEKMKRHADIGADLLSSIRFPYPVVPIVRHHHEFWNGGGYPSGISGPDIPLGARILSVVDCFDALNSDRPYRPRLTPEESFDIIRDRRGSMYDPLVVDTFIRAYPEIAPKAIRAGQEARSIIDAESLQVYGANRQTPLQRITENATEAALLLEGRESVLRAATVQAAVERAGQCLRQLTPATVYALFEYDVNLDVVTCNYTSGDAERVLKRLTIKMGERVSGWCGATRRSSLNSDATLDLHRIALQFQPPLRATISTPIARGERFLGVLTAYSPRAEAFSDPHLYPFEEIASALYDQLDSGTASHQKHALPFPSR
jgi:putative nucleotidyltransferase with HDIG domain